MYIPAECSGNHSVYENKRKLLIERASQTGSSHTSTLNTDARQRNLRSPSRRRPLHEECQEQLEYEQISHQETRCDSEFGKALSNNLPSISQLAYSMYLADLSKYAQGDQAGPLTNELQPNKRQLANVTRQSRKRSFHQMLQDSGSNVSKKRLQKLNKARRSEVGCPLFVQSVDGCEAVKTYGRKKIKLEHCANSNLQLHVPDFRPRRLATARNRVSRKRTGSTRNYFDRQDEQREAVVNTGDGRNEYCSFQLSPFQHQQCGLSDIGNTDTFHDLCGYVPRPFHQYNLATNVSPRPSDTDAGGTDTGGTEVTTRPATGGSNRHGYKYMPGKRPPPGCLAQAGAIKHCAWLPERKHPLLHRTVNLQRHQPYKYSKNNGNDLPIKHPQSQRQHASSHSYYDDDRPSVVASSKFVLLSDGDNGGYCNCLHSLSHGHSLSSDNNCGDGTGGKYPHSGLYESSSCLFQNKLQKGRVWNIFDNAGLLFDRSTEGGSWENCAKFCGQILEHGSNAFTSLASVLSSSNVSTRTAVSAVASGGQSQSSHFGGTTVDEGMSTPCHVTQHSVSTWSGLTARHRTQRNTLSPLHRQVGSPVAYSSQTSAIATHVSDHGKHGRRSSKDHRTRISKRQRKLTCSSKNGSLMSADRVWKTHAVEQFGNSANALLGTSPGEIDENTLSSIAGPWGKTHDASNKQRITFRQCSAAARESHQNVPTFTLHAIRSEEEHTNVHSMNAKGHSNRDSQIKGQFKINPPLHKHINNKPCVSLGNCSSELKSLMRTTIRDLQKYRPCASTGTNNPSLSVEGSALESRIEDKPVPRTRPRGRHFGSHTEQDNSNSRHPQDSSVCPDSSFRCKFNNSDMVPQEISKQNHNPLTGQETTPRTILRWRQGQQTMEHVADISEEEFSSQQSLLSRSLSRIMCQSRIQNDRIGLTTDTVFSRESSTSEVTLGDQENQSQCPGNYCSDIDGEGLESGPCYDRDMVRGETKSSLTENKSRRKQAPGHPGQPDSSTTISQEDLHQTQRSELHKLLAASCRKGGHARCTRLNSDTRTSTRGFNQHGAAWPPDRKKVNKRLAKIKNKLRDENIKSTVRSCGGDDQVHEHRVGISEKSHMSNQPEVRHREYKHNIGVRSDHLQTQCAPRYKYQQNIGDRSDQLQTQCAPRYECKQSVGDRSDQLQTQCAPRYECKQSVGDRSDQLQTQCAPRYECKQSVGDRSDQLQTQCAPRYECKQSVGDRSDQLQTQCAPRYECKQSVGDRSDQLQTQCGPRRECKQRVLCGCSDVDDDASTAGCSHLSSDASLMTHHSAECADLPDQITFTSSCMSHSIRIHSRDNICIQKGSKAPTDTVTTNIHSTIDSLSIPHASEIIQECPNSKQDDTTNGTGSKIQDEYTLVLSTDTSTFQCEGSDDVGTYSVNRVECPKTDIYHIARSKTSSQMHVHPHKLDNLKRAIHDRNVSHENTVNSGPQDSSHLSWHTTRQRDNPLSKDRFHTKTTETAGRKQHYKVRHAGTEHCPLVRKDRFKEKNTHESEPKTRWNHHSRETTHDNLAKERYTHKERIHVISRTYGPGHNRHSEPTSGDLHWHTSGPSRILSDSPRLVLNSGPNYDGQNCVSAQTSSSNSSVYVAQMITNASSLDLSDNRFRLQDELVIKTASRCQHEYLLSSSTRTECSSRISNTDVHGDCIQYTDNDNTYTAREGTSARGRPWSVEKFDDTLLSSLNDALNVDTSQCQWLAGRELGASANSWSDTTATLSHGSSVTGTDGSELPMYCQVTRRSSLLRKARHIPRSLHSPTETMVAYKAVQPEGAQYGLEMARAHRHELSCETDQSSDSFTRKHSCETVQSRDSSTREHSCKTVQFPDSSTREHSCETVHSPDSSTPEHRCGTVQPPNIFNLKHSCETVNSPDISNTEHSFETVHSPDISNIEHSCGAAQSSENWSSQSRNPPTKVPQQGSTSTRKQESYTLSPPSILLDEEHVSYMQIISKEGAFKGFLLSELDELTFSSNLKKSHSKNEDMKHVSCDKLLTIGRHPVSPAVSQAGYIQRLLKCRAIASGAPASGQSAGHGRRTRSRLTGGDSNCRHVVFAQPINREEFVDQEPGPQTCDYLHEIRDCINSQLYQQVHDKSPAPQGSAPCRDCQTGDISKPTQCIDFVKTPKYRKKVHEKEIRVKNSVNVKSVHKMSKPDKTIKRKTVTSQARHPCHKKQSPNPRICPHNTYVGNRLQSKNQDGKKTRQQTPKKHVLMNRQVVTPISNKYQKVATNQIRNESATNKTGENVENTERSTSSNGRDQLGNVPSEELNSKPCSISSLCLPAPPKPKHESQKTLQNVTGFLQTKHMLSPNNAHNQRSQKYSQNEKLKPKANNAESYNAENSQISTHLARFPNKYMVEQMKPLSSKYQNLCRFVDLASVQTVVGNKDSDIFIHNASSRAPAGSTFSAVQKAHPRTVLSSRNVNMLGQNTIPVYKKHMKSQHESSKAFACSSTSKVPVSLKSKWCQLKAVGPCKKAENVERCAENAAGTCPSSEVDDVFKALQKSADVLTVASPPPCQRYRTDLCQAKSTQLHKTKNSQESQKQQTSKKKEHQVLKGNTGAGQKPRANLNPINRVSAVCPPPPRPQATAQRRSICQPIFRPALANVSTKEEPSSRWSRGPLYPKLRGNGGNTAQDTRGQRQSSANSFMKHRDPRALMDVQKQDSTCSPGEAHPRGLPGSNKVCPADGKKHLEAKPRIHNRQVSSRGNRQQKTHKLPDLTSHGNRQQKTHKLPDLTSRGNRQQKTHKLPDLTSHGNRQQKTHQLPDLTSSHQACTSVRPVGIAKFLKAVLAARGVDKTTPLRQSSVATSFTDFRKSPHHYSPMVGKSIHRVKCVPANLHNTIRNTKKEVQTLRYDCSRERNLNRYCPNMYDNSRNVHQQHRCEHQQHRCQHQQHRCQHQQHRCQHQQHRCQHQQHRCEQKQHTPGVTPDCANRQPYKPAANHHAQLGNNIHNSESTTNIHLTSKYAIISPKQGIDIKNCLRMGENRVENLEILQPDTDGTDADITPCCLVIDCSNSPKLRLKTAKCDVNKKMVGHIVSLPFSQDVANVDVSAEQKGRQHMHAGHIVSLPFSQDVANVDVSAEQKGRQHMHAGHIVSLPFSQDVANVDVSAEQKGRQHMHAGHIVSLPFSQDVANVDVSAEQKGRQHMHAGHIVSLPFSQDVANVDVSAEQKGRQHIHAGDEFPGARNQAAYLYGHAQECTALSGQHETQLLTTVSGEVIKIPEPHSLGRSFSPDEQSSTVHELTTLMKAPCGTTPHTDCHQHVVSASAIQLVPVMQAVLQDTAVNNSAKNVHWLSKHLGGHNDFSTEDASMFPNTTDDVSASAIFDNNSSMADTICKHWPSKPKNNKVKPYQYYRKQQTNKQPHNQQQSHTNAISERHGNTNNQPYMPKVHIGQLCEKPCSRKLEKRKLQGQQVHIGQQCEKPCSRTLEKRKLQGQQVHIVQLCEKPCSRTLEKRKLQGQQVHIGQLCEKPCSRRLEKRKLQGQQRHQIRH